MADAAQRRNPQGEKENYGHAEFLDASGNHDRRRGGLGIAADISPSSPAVDSGLRRGDDIQQVNRKPVKNTSDFEIAMRHSKDQTRLLVNRQGTTMYVAV